MGMDILIREAIDGEIKRSSMKKFSRSYTLREILCYVSLQPEDLFLFCVEFFLGNDTAVEQILVFFQLVRI